MSRTHQTVILCLLFVVVVFGQDEGEKCRVQKTGQKGRCILLDDCDYAKGLLKARQRPQNCGFKGVTPIVCCPLTTKPAPGQISKKQCEIFYPKPVNTFKRFVFAGKPSLAKEFPHMAVLGYGDEKDIQWLCGGSVISEQFVLTAAHCITSQEYGTVKHVRLGDLDIKNTTDDAKPQNFTVVKTFIHPQYRSSSYYNDIAIIQLNGKAEFNDYVRPACLYPNKTLSNQLTATGWGKVEFFGETSSHLMKVDLNYVKYETCAKSYQGDAKLKTGIADESQVCAGDEKGGDTCPGDSGGPLQFKETSIPAHFYVVGVTSFGKACGLENSVGVYTRVSHYLGWIENIVWPSK